MPDYNEAKYDQPTGVPTQKVLAGGLGGSLSVVLIFLVKSLFDIEVPAEVASAVTTVVAFVAAYMTRDKQPVTVIKAIEKATPIPLSQT